MFRADAEGNGSGDTAKSAMAAILELQAGEASANILARLSVARRLKGLMQTPGLHIRVVVDDILLQAVGTVKFVAATLGVAGKTYG